MFSLSPAVEEIEVSECWVPRDCTSLLVAVNAHVCVGSCSAAFYQGQRAAETPLPDVITKMAGIKTGGKVVQRWQNKMKSQTGQLYIDAGSVDV